MPGSPDRSKALGPAGIESRKRWRIASSDSRPMTSPVNTLSPRSVDARILRMAGPEPLQTVVAQSHPAVFGGRHAIVRTVKCPSCGTANPDDARFCNACGTRLGLTADGDALDPFLPKELLAK